MKQVDPKIYSKKFFSRVYGNDNQKTGIDGDLSKEYYKEMLTILKPNKKSFIVDYGCGNGSLSFLLWKKYKSKIVAFDYSSDAIDICNKRLKKFKKKFPKADISFFVANNNKLPRLKGVTHVYFCDVVEHMYDPEIILALSKIKKWATRKVLVIIHTDNNIYLKFVRPFINLIYLVAGKKTVKKIKTEQQEESLVHVNLTNFFSLKNFVTTQNFRHIKTLFPKVTNTKVVNQLGSLSQFKWFVYMVRHLAKKLSFLSPSFFSVFEYQVKK